MINELLQCDTTLSTSLTCDLRTSRLARGSMCLLMQT